MSYMVFATQQEAQAACDAIWLKMVRERAVKHGDTLINVRTGKVVPNVSKLPDSELKDSGKYPLLGYTAGKLDLTHGNTTMWDVPYKRLTDGKWVVCTPSPEMVAACNLQNVPTEEPADAWWPEDDEE